jgi:hypothetical protein
MSQGLAAAREPRGAGRGRQRGKGAAAGGKGIDASGAQAQPQPAAERSSARKQQGSRAAMAPRAMNCKSCCSTTTKHNRFDPTQTIQPSSQSRLCSTTVCAAGSGAAPAQRADSPSPADPQTPATPTRAVYGPFIHRIGEACERGAWVGGASLPLTGARRNRGGLGSATPGLRLPP